VFFVRASIDRRVTTANSSVDQGHGSFGQRADVAQQPTMPVVGFLNSSSAAATNLLVAAFRQGLGEAGYTEGKNVAIEYRWAEGHYDRLQSLAAELVRHQVAVIAATGGGSGLAAKAVTTSIPIVFTTGADPVKEGLVVSINRPDANATGVNLLLNAVEGKKLGLLREVIPTAALFGALLNPANSSFDTQMNDVTEAAHAMGHQIRILRAGSEPEIDAAFSEAVRMNVGGLVVGADAFFLERRSQLVALEARYLIPSIFHSREITKAGGLMSYGTDVPDGYRQVGIYTGRILKGEKPAQLPVISTVKFDFAVNVKTARALDLKFSPDLLSIADEVIE
jgi:putative tryptophan/tyrosine transport system substrate-binding protein